MDESYKILRYLLALFEEKTNIDATVSLYLSLGVIVPIIILGYSIISYLALFSPYKWVKKKLVILQLIYISFTVVIIAAIGGVIVYICL